MNENTYKKEIVMSIDPHQNNSCIYFRNYRGLRKINEMRDMMKIKRIIIVYVQVHIKVTTFILNS